MDELFKFLIEGHISNIENKKKLEKSIKEKENEINTLKSILENKEE